MGLSVENAHHRLKLIERVVAIVPEHPQAYAEWKKLLLAHTVIGVQVHDARIAAAMRVNGIRHLLTLNRGDFARYGRIAAVTPAELMAAGAP